MSSKFPIPLPAYTFRLRLSQLILAVLILILNIVSTAVISGYGALSYGIFTPLATCVIVIYWYYASYKRLDLYNRWAILILDCFAVVWWLSLWSVLASWAAALGFLDVIDNTYGFSSTASIDIVHALTAVAAVLGAAEFVLFIVSLISFSINLNRTRISERQGGHQNPFTNHAYPTESFSNTNPQSGRPKGGLEVSA